uniref:exodeoxyribonuclease V subunit beta n=1 Tax=Ningiella ruwaisensis TaxID=2364274 RepID=UPI001448392C|nr:exodeoxyribonuclease V subunit beta [Ningiella ruwaisensis]
MRNDKAVKALNPTTLPLEGKHLIEASAGTGKTFNITRLYVRLLVERNLSVNQILVMTFTEAATDEIKSRVSEFIDEVLDKWHTEDEFVRHLKQAAEENEAFNRLQSAKLNIDDASIFTIHGFCQRVLTQFSASLQHDANAQVTPDISRLYQQCIGDYIIALQKNSRDFLLLKEQAWHTPRHFFDVFQTVFYHQGELRLTRPDEVWHEFVAEANEHWQAQRFSRDLLIKHLREQDFWFAGLVDNPKNRSKIQTEINQALECLSQSMFLNESEAEQLYEQSLESGFESSLASQITHKSLEALLGSSRRKKYPDAWQDKLTTLYESIYTPIIDQVKRDNKQRLDRRLRNCLALESAYWVIESVKSKVQHMMQDQSLLSFDDLIRLVAQALDADSTAENKQKQTAGFICSQLQTQFPAALVDEFQDTDAQQYQILASIYQTDNQPHDKGVQNDAEFKPLLIMIGDPKQAIYGFRGGDVFTYLKAGSEAEHHWSMDTNWRSTPDMVDAYNFVFNDKQGSSFDFTIAYHAVKAAQGKLKPQSALVVNNPAFEEKHRQSALQLICADVFLESNETADDRQQSDDISVKKDCTSIDEQRHQILDWMVKEIKCLLADGQIHEDISQTSSHRVIKPVEAKDIAILVRAGFEATMIKDFLSANGLSSVYLSEKSPLFESKEAKHLYYVLDAIHTTNNQRKCIAALSTGLFYLNPSISTQELINDNTHPHWQNIYRKTADYHQLWKRKGIFALLNELIKHAFDSQAMPFSVERALTNYQHLADIMAQAAVTYTTQSSQLRYLKRQINGLEQSDTAQLRLESDDGLIKIVTQHKSKGLEYPIVFLPFANTLRSKSTKVALRYHDSNDALVMRLGPTQASEERAEREDIAEDTRLLYVALTRPIYRCYLGMLVSENMHESAIHRLFALSESTNELINAKINANKQSDILNKSSDQTEPQINFGAKLAHMFEQKYLSSTEVISMRMASDVCQPVHKAPVNDEVEIRVNTLSRSITQSWFMSSFTQLSKSMHLQNQLDSTDSALSYTNKDHEDEVSQSGIKEQVETESETMRFSMIKGALSGNILHDCLEWLDFSQADYDELLTKIEQKYPNFLSTIAGNKARKTQQSLLLNEADTHSLQKAFADWMQNILNATVILSWETQPDVQAKNTLSFSLKHLDSNKCLKEAEFYLPIQKLHAKALQACLNRHRDAVSQHYRFSKTPAKAISYDQLDGMLHGFIDLSFEYRGKFYVCDYKSTHLGNRFEDYLPDKIARNIQMHDYDLQYLLYSLAMHRYLKSTLENYEFKTHFGGVLYLYLRGMQACEEDKASVITDVNKQTGIYFTEIPLELIEELDHAFAATTHDNNKITEG